MFSWSTFLDARNYSSSLSHWEVYRHESCRNIQGRNPSHKARAPVTSQSEQELAELHRLQVKVIQDVGELWGPACPLVTVSSCRPGSSTFKMPLTTRLFHHLLILPIYLLPFIFSIHFPYDWLSWQSSCLLGWIFTSGYILGHSNRLSLAALG